MLYLSVFSTSAAVMIFELVGGRIIGPFLGTSTEVWSTTIACVLCGLSLGYWLGGYAADKKPSVHMIAGIIQLGGLSVLAIWGIKDILMLSVSGLVLEYGSTLVSLISGLVLFVPTSILLGAVTPYASRLALRSLEHSGRTVGTLSALGAIGSVVGTLAAGLWLIPAYGSSNLLISLAIFLILLSFIVSASHMLKARIGITGIALVLALASAAMLGRPAELIADIDTSYSRIWIYDHGNASEPVWHRFLKTDPYGIQCSKDMKNEDNLLFSYTQAFLNIIEARPVSEAPALLLGGCNYSFPGTYLRSQKEGSMTVVEIDPGMTEASREYFGFRQDPRMTIIHQDARLYLNTATGTFSAIFVDTFNSQAAIPYQMTTKETAERLKSLIAEDGIVVLNTIDKTVEGEAGVLNSLYLTLKSVFPHVEAYAASAADPAYARNIILIAGNEELDDSWLALGSGQRFVRLPHRQLDGGMLLTDDYAPTDYLVRKARAGTRWKETR